MASLTPPSRSDEATSSAFTDGLVSGAITMIPAGLGLALAMRYPAFVKATNWQSRTAMVVMPPLFVYAWSAEHKLGHKMMEIAQDTEHNRAVAKWAQEEQRRVTTTDQSPEDSERQLMALYKQGIENSGIRVVPGDRLSPHHMAANYWQENPMKVLVAVGLPAVAYIFYGRNQQQHLQLQSKLMHTRVFGQFAVISSLLCIMGFKAYMDANGKFVTEWEANQRVEEMWRTRQELLASIQQGRHREEERAAILKRAQEHDGAAPTKKVKAVPTTAAVAVKTTTSETA